MSVMCYKTDWLSLLALCKQCIVIVVNVVDNGRYMDVDKWYQNVRCKINVWILLANSA